MRRLLALIPLFIALATASPAAAQRCEAPPGTAAVDEYCETIPTVTGDRSADARPEQPVALPPGTVEELQKEGEDGAALLRQLGYDPDPAKAKEQAERYQAPAPAGGTEPAPKEPEFNAFDTVGEIISAGPTMGSGFIAVLLAVIAFMLAWAWIDYRRRTTSD